MGLQPKTVIIIEADGTENKSYRRCKRRRYYLSKNQAKNCRGRYGNIR